MKRDRERIKRDALRRAIADALVARAWLQLPVSDFLLKTQLWQRYAYACAHAHRIRMTPTILFGRNGRIDPRRARRYDPPPRTVIRINTDVLGTQRALTHIAAVIKSLDDAEPTPP